MSMHRSILSTHCIKAIVPSIKYLDWQKIRLLFRLIKWQVTLQYVLTNIQ